MCGLNSIYLLCHSTWDVMEDLTHRRESVSSSSSLPIPVTNFQNWERGSGLGNESSYPCPLEFGKNFPTRSRYVFNTQTEAGSGLGADIQTHGSCSKQLKTQEFKNQDSRLFLNLRIFYYTSSRYSSLSFLAKLQPSVSALCT